MKEDLKEQIRQLKNIIVQMSYDIENKNTRLQLLFKQRDELKHKLLTKHK
jgi:SMC interacting uncharacterized protein involved in chromosome segregation